MAWTQSFSTWWNFCNNAWRDRYFHRTNTNEPFQSFDHMQVGKVPSKWKISSVVPIPKSSANIDNPLNYGPISLLSVVSKIMERHIYSIVFEHLAERDLSLLHNGGFALGNSQLQFLCQLFMTFSNSWIMVLMSPLSFFDLHKSIWHCSPSSTSV